MSFSMVVKQVFNFSDGRTVLAGPVEGEVPMIGPGRYGLFRGNMLVREVEIEGEMIPKADGTVRADRAISVALDLGLASGEPQERLTVAPLGRRDVPGDHDPVQ